MDYPDLPALIASRMRALEIASQRELRALLSRRGCTVSANTVSAWCTGRKAPAAHHLAALLDTLAVYGSTRDAAYRLAYGGAE